MKKKMLSRWLPVVLGIGLFLIVDHYDSDFQALLIVLGFLTLAGFTAVYDKLEKLSEPPHVKVKVCIKFQVNDDETALDGETISKAILFSFLPRIGDRISDHLDFIGVVEKFEQMGSDEELVFEPRANIVCTRKVKDIKILQDYVAGYKQNGWE